MPIMYEPQTGMPVQVPNGRINDFLGRGYRTAPPYKPVEISNPSTEKLIGEKAPDLVKVNSATLKELTESFGLSTAQAKDLRDGRPYMTVEDLIAKIPNIDWVALSPKISFE